MCSEKVLSFVNTFSLGTAAGGLCRQAQGRSHTHTSFLQPFQILPQKQNEPLNENQIQHMGTFLPLKQNK